MMVWELGIPGKAGVSEHQLLEADEQTNWEGGMYKVLATFPEGKLPCVPYRTKLTR
jgi:hypothetical protein